MGEPSITDAARKHAPELVFGVDWSSLGAYRSLKSSIGGAAFVYLNYRVFSRTATGGDLELVQRYVQEQGGGGGTGGPKWWWWGGGACRMWGMSWHLVAPRPNAMTTRCTADAHKQARGECLGGTWLAPAG